MELEMAGKADPSSNVFWEEIKTVIEELTPLVFSYQTDKGTGTVKQDGKDIVIIDSQLKDDGVVLFYNIKCYTPVAVKVSIQISEVVDMVYVGDVFYDRVMENGKTFMYFGPEAEDKFFEDIVSDKKAEVPVLTDKESHDIRILQELPKEGWKN
jgi:hypothetical protein